MNITFLMSDVVVMNEGGAASTKIKSTYSGGSARVETGVGGAQRV
jgi:hypothetical protein